MYLSKLKINGFKSFANSTNLSFSDGLTGIIGPNGCGKSNIVDAIRWVLGEQKVSSLRSDKMENVIFNGTSDRKPLGMAEVALTIENNKNILPSEFTEVVITRRLFRSGESQYLLNNQPVRLKDIQNLFIDTGMSTDAYSIIELKMVELILSDNKDERRRLFEEAAGIKKYKMHRRAALRKLELTRNELTRLTDIINEVNRAVNSLARQVSKTKRYQVLKEELRQREIDSHLYKYQKYLESTGPLKEELEDIKSNKEKFAAQVSLKEGELESIKKVALDIEKEFQEIQRNLAKEQSQLQEFEKLNLVDKQRLEMLNNEKNRAGQELLNTRFKIDEINAFLEKNEPKVTEISDDEIKIETQFEEVSLEKENLTVELEKNREQLNAKTKISKEFFQNISHLQEEINQKKFQIFSRNEEKEKLEVQLIEIEKAAEEKEKSFLILKEKTENSKKHLSKLEQNREGLFKEKETKETLIKEQQNQLVEFEKTLSNLEKEIKIYNNILESYEGYSSAIQYVMKNFSENGNIIDTLPNLFSVDSKVQEEISHFLSELANIVVVKNVNVAENVLAEIQNNKKGNLSIVPEICLDENTEPLEIPEAEPVINYIHPVKNHQKIVTNLFKNVYKTNSVSKAVELQKKYPATTFIAPNGYTTGSIFQIKGGSKNSSLTDLVGRKNYIKKLEIERDKCSDLCMNCKNKIDAFELELEKVNKQFDEIETSFKQLKSELEILTKDLQRSEFELSSTSEKKSEIIHRIEEINSQIIKWEGELTKSKPHLEKLTFDFDNMEDELEEIKKNVEYEEEDLKKCSEEYNRLNIELVQLKNEKQTLTKEIFRNKNMLLEFSENKDKLEQDGLKKNDEHIEILNKKILERTEILHKMTTSFAKKEEEKNNKEEIYQEKKNELLTIEEEIFKNRRNWNQAQDRIKELEFKIQEHQLKANGVQEQLLEYYNYEITESKNFDDFNPEVNKIKIEETNNTLVKIGEVNLLAVDEHAKEKERLKFLKEQEADILSAETQLLETIDELNKTAVGKFNETYEAIRENFKKVFKEFFASGEADLELIDRNDPLESDINIKVTPKGRKLQTLTLMSAGEKTLTAISLLFSIYLVKPSPFCILDEVDAPLDDVNIGRFTGALDSFSHNTQFLVVTHNKKTMEKMDSIYGITMEKEGVSKVVSVQFD